MSRTIYSQYKNIRKQDVYIIPKHIEAFGPDTKDTIWIRMISGEKHILHATLTDIQSIIDYD